MSLTGPAYSDAEARARAELALRRVRMPPGAVPLSDPPEPGFGFGSPGCCQTFITDTHWWWIPGTVEQFGFYLAAHPPAGFSLGPGGVDRGVLGQDVVPQGHSGAPDVDTFEIGAQIFGDHVDVAANVAVLVTPHRTSDETTRPALRAATLRYDRVPIGTTLVPALKRERVLTGADLLRLTSALNALPTFPGFPGCPGMPQVQQQSTLTMRYDDGDRAEYDIAFGCGGVNVLINGTQQPYLDHDDDVAALTLQLLGVSPLPS